MHSGLIRGELAYLMLKKIGLRDAERESGTAFSYQGRSKLEALLGPAVWEQIKGKSVIDYGCGQGAEVVEMAQRGARRVIGLDTWDKVLQKAERNAEEAGVAKLCEFTKETSEQVDVIFSLDAFEHYKDPASVLEHMFQLLNPGGKVIICFGPPWLHPFGGHLFSVFPWSHLLFSESAQLHWRNDFKHDGATRFHEVDGGLNQMTLRRFRELVADSKFVFEKYEPVPIRKLRLVSNALTREFTTSVLRCVLQIRAPA